MKLSKDQLTRLRAFVEREEKEGSSCKRMVERFVSTFGEKAANKRKIESWYNEYSTARSGRRKSLRLRAREPQSVKATVSNCYDTSMLPGLRCVIKDSKLNAEYFKRNLRCAPSASESRYVFIYMLKFYRRFYVIDTFHDDIQ